VVKNIYNLGARSFWIHNTGPIGCLPLILTNFESAERDMYGCAKAYNEVANSFNQNLKKALAHLRKDLPTAAITYVDIYSVKYSLFRDPKKYGESQIKITLSHYPQTYQKCVSLIETFINFQDLSFHMLLVVAMEGSTTSVIVLAVEEPLRSMTMIFLWVLVKDHQLE